MSPGFKASNPMRPSILLKKEIIKKKKQLAIPCFACMHRIQAYNKAYISKDFPFFFELVITLVERCNSIEGVSYQQSFS